jgi:hypothetical protein
MLVYCEMRTMDTCPVQQDDLPWQYLFYLAEIVSWRLLLLLSLQFLALCSSFLQFPELGVDLRAMLYFFCLKLWNVFRVLYSFDKEKLSD